MKKKEKFELIVIAIIIALGIWATAQHFINKQEEVIAVQQQKIEKVSKQIEANAELTKELSQKNIEETEKNVELTLVEKYATVPLNIRYHVGTDSEKYTTVPVNTKLSVIEGFNMGDWVKVVYDEKELYVNSKYLSDKPVEVKKKTVAKSKSGRFLIYHYAGDGITATGTKPTPGRTIAVDPKVIPYGSKVVINGHVYIAEDCGGAIKGNVIDMYVSSEQEAKQKGKYYTEVYWY